MVSRMPFDPRRIAIVFCAICAFLHLYSPQAVLPLMAQEFGVGAAAASLIITASTLAVAATAPFTGALSDLLGRRRVIIAAMALLLVPGVMLPLSGSMNELIFWRFVQGLLLPPIFAVAIAYIGDEWPPQQATVVIGSYTSASAVAGFVGRFIPGMLVAYVGWRGGFLTLAGLTAICLLIVATMLPRETKFVRASDMRASLRQMVAHLGNPKLLATYAVGFGVLFNFIAVFTYMSFHLAGPPFNRSAAFIGAIFVVYLAGAAAAALSGRMIAKFGRRRFVLAVLAAWAVGVLVMLVPSVPVIVCGLAVASICGVLTQASSTGYVAITAQGGTSSAVGLYVTSFYVGGTAGGWLAGLAYEAGGWPATLALVLGMLAVMAAVVATCWSRT
jgi:MFS transporter, YNFM family, putative membrane transport protein